MRLETAILVILPFFGSCQDVSTGQTTGKKIIIPDNPVKTIADILLPPGFKRIIAAPGSFAAWLRMLSLKKDKTVYLYNGDRKKNQSAQFAVVDISVGSKDLQQCADAVIRMRAEYLYSHHRFAEIDFTDNNQIHYRITDNTSRNEFNQYLEQVFSRCGTLSLSRQLDAVNDFTSVEPGNVLIKGGSPGHAMMVMDVAVDGSGRKIYLLAQSYMPAQDIHIVVNPANRALSPWYEVRDSFIPTPEWSFETSQLKKWPVPNGLK